MDSIINTNEYRALYQKQRYIHLKIQLLDWNDNVIDSYTGISISGNINLNGSSTYRRTANLTVKLRDNLIPKPSGQIWFNRKIRLSVGIAYNKDIVWYEMGSYVVQKATLDHGAGTQTISMNLLDYMALLDGTLFGSLSHQTELKVKEGVKVNHAIATTVDYLPKISIDRFEIDGMDMVIPYDMEFSPNSTVYNIVNDLVGLYMSQEFYFDKNGVFRVARIRNKKSDPIFWDFTKTNMDLLISPQRQLDFSNVKNSIWVWGNVSDTGKHYYWSYRNEFDVDNVSDLNNIKGAKDGSLCYVHNTKSTYLYENSQWNETDIEIRPEFNIANIGEKIFAVNDTKIQTDEQARLRAEYELEKTSNLAESISIEVIPIYLLEPNMKIRINDEKTGINGDYLIQSISVGLQTNSTMNIVAEKIYY